jgi:hypothetical protein
MFIPKTYGYTIGMHLSWNLFQSLLGFNVNGGDNYSLIVITMKDANRINGGPFGLEGSYYITLAAIILLIGQALYHQRNKTIEA